jgi:hypothetical protein
MLAGVMLSFHFPFLIVTNCLGLAYLNYLK